MKEKLLKIINHYGIRNQQRKLQEEVLELQEQISLHTWDLKTTLGQDRKYFKYNITEELSDVLVLLEQIRFYYDIDLDDIYDIFKTKVNRQLLRMEEE